MDIRIRNEVNSMERDLIAFTQELVQIRSYSGQEEKIARFITEKMKALGFDEVHIDSMGNVIGRIGYGSKSIMFDSHMDTVAVNDEQAWLIPPFSGDIVDSRIYGRGSVDMKSGAAASIYAASIIKKLGMDKERSIFISCTVSEEDCDGENLKSFFRENSLKPDYFITCEPSNNRIALGHKGKAQISIKTKGVSAHGSAPEKGINAIYEMAEIIQRVEKTNNDLMRKAMPFGTLVLSDITSSAVSLNAVPYECEIYLDRRMVLGETEETIRNEMDNIIDGKNAKWEIGKIQRSSWTGKEIEYKPFHLAWKIDLNHKLTRECIEAFDETFGKYPEEFEFWDFSTNAVTPVSMGIPTIGFGPGEYKLAHMTDENCQISQIVDACLFYATLITKL